MSELHSPCLSNWQRKWILKWPRAGGSQNIDQCLFLKLPVRVKLCLQRVILFGGLSLISLLYNHLFSSWQANLLNTWRELNYNLKLWRFLMTLSVWSFTVTNPELAGNEKCEQCPGLPPDGLFKFPQMILMCQLSCLQRTSYVSGWAAPVLCEVGTHHITSCQQGFPLVT